MRKTYILIDYENVQPDSVSPLDKECIQLMVFIGENQSKIPYPIASALQRMGGRAEYIKISGNGSNALDFHIAFYIGRIAAGDQDAYFYIISKDTGFDPLIQHLKGLSLNVARMKEIADIPFVKKLNAESPADRAAIVTDRLMRASRPRTLKTLHSTIHALFQKSLSEQEIGNVVKELEKQKKLVINDGKVSYTL